MFNQRYEPTRREVHVVLSKIPLQKTNPKQCYVDNGIINAINTLLPLQGKKDFF